MLHPGKAQTFLFLVFVLAAFRLTAQTKKNQTQSQSQTQTQSQPQTGHFQDFLKKQLPQYNHLFDNKLKYRLQIIYIRIDRDSANVPHFTQFSFNNNPELFFYCASTVKLPASMLALEKIETLNKLGYSGLTRQSTMITDSVFYCEHRIARDTSSENGLPSIENYIKKMLLVSDNVAFSRTYEFLTCDYIHTRLAEKGYPSMRLVNKLDAGCMGDTSKIAPPVYFLDSKNDTIYRQTFIQKSTMDLPSPIPDAKVGTAHHDNWDRKVPGPKDFSRHNYIPLQNLSDILKSLVFMPYINSPWKLNPDDRLFLLKQMGMMPRESAWPRYSFPTYYDSYKKYLLYGSMVPKIRSDSVRSFNIVGQAYGFLTDCAYIVDVKNKVEFLLAATIYVNESEDVGSGNYQTHKTGLPFLRDLGYCLYRTELLRKKAILPDLSEFNFYN